LRFCRKIDVADEAGELRADTGGHRMFQLRGLVKVSAVWQWFT
jgi:hypothetical protein